MGLTRDEASALADRIDGDPRNDGAYEAHGLGRDAGGWFVAVSDLQATDANPGGRALEVRTDAEFMRALTGR